MIIIKGYFWSNLHGEEQRERQLLNSMVESLKIIVPPIELQNQFADFVHQVDKSKVTVQKAFE